MNNIKLLCPIHSERLILLSVVYRESKNVSRKDYSFIGSCGCRFKAEAIGKENIDRLDSAISKRSEVLG